MVRLRGRPKTGPITDILKSAAPQSHPRFPTESPPPIGPPQLAGSVAATHGIEAAHDLHHGIAATYGVAATPRVAATCGIAVTHAIATTHGIGTAQGVTATFRIAEARRIASTQTAGAHETAPTSKTLHWGTPTVPRPTFAAAGTWRGPHAWPRGWAPPPAAVKNTVQLPGAATRVPPFAVMAITLSKCFEDISHFTPRSC